MATHREIVKALNNIRPNAEWTLRDGNFENLEWLDMTQSKPTKIEIDAAIEIVKQAEAEAAAKKAAAEAKLAALGLTADDLKALGLGGN
jgi:hypothetical protein